MPLNNRHIQAGRRIPVVATTAEGDQVANSDIYLPVQIVEADGALIPVRFGDSPSVDGFGRLRVSQTVVRIDASFTYGLQPLIFEQITNGVGATITHDAANRNALMTFSDTPAGGLAYMQSYEWAYYLPGNSHIIIPTFNFKEHVPNVTKFVGYGDRTNNGIHFLSNGTGFAWRILSNTDNGDETVLQADWNLDRLDGTGPSGIDLKVANGQIAVIDFQALYTGRVRVGFDFDGITTYCHEFLHANRVAPPYIQVASLPVICGMSCSDTASTTMAFNCVTVRSEGADLTGQGFGNSIEGTGTAGNGARAHLLSLRPKATFGGFENRSTFVLDTLDFLVTGNNPIKWELVVGQAISGTTTFNDVNATYSSFEYNTAGTISGDPAVVLESEYVSATASSPTSVTAEINNRYPIALNAAGAPHALGTLSVLATGIGGTSATRVTANWRELR